MLSPAAQHKMNVLAQQRGAEQASLSAQGASNYELMLYQLSEHRRTLKTVQSMDNKAELKRKFLPHYLPYLEGVLTSNSGHQDDVLVTMMIWMLDIGDLQAALPLIEYALRHQLTTPEHYERNLPCLVAEDVGEAAIRAVADEKPLDAEVLSQIVELTKGMDMFDQARSKLFKALGLTLAHHERFADAVPALQESHRLNDKSGVKKMLEKCIAAAKKLNVNQPAQPELTQQTAAAGTENPDKPEPSTDKDSPAQATEQQTADGGSSVPPEQTEQSGS